LLSSITDRLFKVTLPAASLFEWPGTFTPGVTDRVYGDRDELADHIVSLLRQMIDGAVEDGAKYIQCDFPLYPLFVDKERHQARWRAMGLDDEEYLGRLLRVDREVVAGLPGDVTTSVHLCRGNTSGAWMAEGSLEPVAERMFNELPYDRFLLELDDRAHQGDYSQLRHLPKGKVVVLGIVSSHTVELEDEDELLREIELASRHVDIDQLAISPQCGFASLVDFQGTDVEPSTHDSQWRKLELLTRVADRVWPR
jgi:5-methyltetrahydropteroyltriglutamate--homocysteine methyltransferase